MNIENKKLQKLFKPGNQKHFGNFIMVKIITKIL